MESCVRISSINGRAWLREFGMFFLLAVVLRVVNLVDTVAAASQGTSISPTDEREDSLYDPVQADPDCPECKSPPTSTIESVTIDASWSYGGEDPDSDMCMPEPETIVFDKHWGSNPRILRMRDRLRASGSGESVKLSGKQTPNRRPPIFLMPGLASTRLVAWRYKACPHHPLLSDIKVQDYVWLNINLLMQVGTLDVSCFVECLQLGWNQSDSDDINIGCKLRPDEGLDAISSLSPGGIGSQLLVGGTNTVYAWLIQWLADNLGYDVSNIVGLPYDWRMSPDKLEERDGFLTLTRRRMEAAVQTNGKPGIVVAHSMGNAVFRYFLEWLKAELQEEAYQRYIKQAERRARAMKKVATLDEASTAHGWMTGVFSHADGASTPRGDEEQNDVNEDAGAANRHKQLWELAQIEGEANWYDWIETHIWTYVGLSAPLLGAVNPLRAVLSGENMGLPMTDEAARAIEVTFGSTHTVNPISSKEGFCDQWDVTRWDEEPSEADSRRHADSRLACLEDIAMEIEFSGGSKGKDPWANFSALKMMLQERLDWDSDRYMIRIVKELCEEKEKTPCTNNATLNIGPRDVQSGEIFTKFSEIWKEKEDPLVIKRDQLRESFWDTKVTNILNRTWERPLIKHVIMAYGVDISTEVGYQYRKTEQAATNKNSKDASFDGIPNLEKVLWETAGGQIHEETLEGHRGGLADYITKKKPKRKKKARSRLAHSGDGSVPYLSLAWAHTWLLHGVRALRFSGKEEGSDNPLDDIKVSHRPKGKTEWVDGPPPKQVVILGEKKVEESSDTGTAHPHGTKYKPEMVRFHSEGISRTTGIQYTTSVIEAIGVEHKETTRNYDILAAVFTDVLEFMHDDLNIL